MSSTQPDWELSKENIQPLKSGRKASKLENISKPKDLKALNEERMQYESELRMYDGPDPLDPWYRPVTRVTNFLSPEEFLNFPQIQTGKVYKTYYVCCLVQVHHMDRARVS